MYARTQPFYVDAPYTPGYVVEEPYRASFGGRAPHYSPAYVEPSYVQTADSREVLPTAVERFYPEERLHVVKKKRHTKPFSSKTMQKLAGPGMEPGMKVAGVVSPLLKESLLKTTEFDDTASVASYKSSASNWSQYSNSGKGSRRARTHEASLVKPYRKKHQRAEMDRGRARWSGQFDGDNQTVVSSYSKRSIRKELEREMKAAESSRKGAHREDPPVNVYGLPVPPDPPSQLNLAEIILLLHCKDGKLSQRHTRMADVELSTAAALLMDLYLMGKIEPHPNTVRTPSNFLMRLVNTEPIGESHLDAALARICALPTRESKNVEYWVWTLFKSLGGKKLVMSLAQSLVHRGLFRLHGTDEFEVNNEVAYADAYRHIDVLMGCRDSGEEAPIRCSIVGVLYWLPQDWVQYAFGQSGDAYESKQMCKAIVHAVQSVWHSA